MSSKRFAVPLVLLALLLAVPSFGAPAPTAPAPAAIAAQPACPGVDVLDLAALATNTASPQGSCQAAPAATGIVDPFASAETGVKFRGYCRCGCSQTKNCNTSADCGGGTCSPTISCC